MLCQIYLEGHLLVLQKLAAAELLVAVMVLVGGRRGQSQGQEREEEGKGKELHCLFRLSAVFERVK